MYPMHEWARISTQNLDMPSTFSSRQSIIRAHMHHLFSQAVLSQHWQLIQTCFQHIHICRTSRTSFLWWTKSYQLSKAKLRQIKQLTLAFTSTVDLRQTHQPYSFNLHNETQLTYSTWHKNHSQFRNSWKHRWKQRVQLSSVVSVT